MKRRIASLVLVLSMLVGVTSAAARKDLRWNYFLIVNSNIVMRDGTIVWSGDADAYPAQSVTKTKITVKLQIATVAGWGTIETDSYTATHTTSAGGEYTGWDPGENYRVKVEAWCYNGSTELEHVGPYYDYLST